MNRFLALLHILTLCCTTLKAQMQPVTVAENTFKVNGVQEEVFYYGFAEGDQIIFDFEERKGKEIKEIEIVEFPGTSRFLDYKSTKVNSKTLQVVKEAVYAFRFTNTAISGRVCNFTLKRIPASEATRNFSTTVNWRTQYDTTYTQSRGKDRENVLVGKDTAVVVVLDQVAKISSQTALNGNPNKTVVDFTLPDSTISWSYYIGVGEEGKAEYDAVSTAFLQSASQLALETPGYGALASLAFTGLSAFNKVQGPDNVKYWFISDWANVQLFKSGNTFLQYKQGDVINDAAQMQSPLGGKIYLGLLNDNIIEPMEVVLKATAIQVKLHYEEREVQKMNVSSRQVPYLINQ